MLAYGSISSDIKWYGAPNTSLTIVIFWLVMQSTALGARRARFAFVFMLLLSFPVLSDFQIPVSKYFQI
jgi:hypothetical protein